MKAGKKKQNTVGGAQSAGGEPTLSNVVARGGVLQNRTGALASPIDSKAQAAAADAMQTEPESGLSTIADARADYEREAGPVGSMPPPVKAGAPSASSELGKNPALLDKLAERLAFERAGTRLYEALLAKLDVRGTFDGGPTREQLLKAHEEELAHFQLLTEAIISLGGDPTALTPCADVAAVATIGLPQVIADPRTSLGQALHALLIAELVDNDGWDVLIGICSQLGADELADTFTQARDHEDEHLENVREWINAHAILMLRKGSVAEVTRVSPAGKSAADAPRA